MSVTPVPIVSDVNVPQQESGSAERVGGLRLGLATAASVAMCVGAALWAGAARAGRTRADAAPAAALPVAASKASRDAVVKQLMMRDLIGSVGKEVLMVTVEYLPGGASLPHRHNAQVFVYVLEGRVRMQVEGSAAVTLGPGETFYEGPDDIHTISANASRTKSARILVWIVKDKGAPVSSEAGPEKRT